MYLTAVCDDEREELDKLEAVLKAYGSLYTETGLMVKRFEKAEELLESIRKEECVPDLILMDIYLPDKLGTDAARELRQMGKETRIVFLTVSRDHALEAFRVNAAQYLVKPVLKEELYPLLDRLFREIEEEKKKYLLFRTGGKVCRVVVDEIVYCEAQRKSQRVYLADGTWLLLHMTMAALFDRLSVFPGFVRAGAAYVVNLRYIENINYRQITLEGGRVLYLPRGSYKVLREKYFQYYCDEE